MAKLKELYNNCKPNPNIIVYHAGHFQDQFTFFYRCNKNDFHGYNSSRTNAVFRADSDGWYLSLKEAEKNRQDYLNKACERLILNDRSKRIRNGTNI